MPLSIRHPNRRKIYAFLRLAPGMHLRDLERELDMPLGTLEHHLKKLEEMGKVSARSHGRYKSFYPTNHIERTDKTYLYYLHQTTPRRLILALLETPKTPTPAQDLAEGLELAPSTISHHANKLVEAGLVAKSRDGPRVVYALTEPSRVKRLMLEYPGSYLASFGHWFRLAWDEKGARPGADAVTPSSSTSSTKPSRRSG